MWSKIVLFGLSALVGGGVWLLIGPVPGALAFVLTFTIIACCQMEGEIDRERGS